MKSRKIPSFAVSVFAVWSRNFLQFKKTWIASAFWIVLEPLLVLLAFGYGLGSFIPQVQGFSYIEFFFPALLCNSVMLVSFFECTYASFTKMQHSKVFHSILLSPLLPKHLFWGEVFWGATKGIFSAVGVIFIATIFGAVSSFRIIFALPVVFLLGLIFALFGLLITSVVKNYDQIIYPSSGVIVPLSLFSGTYFPLESLPIAFRYLSYLSPLTHAVLGVRQIYTGLFSYWLIAHILFLLIIIYFLAKKTESLFTKRILN